MALPFLQAKKWKKRHAEHFTCHGGAFAETGAMHRVGATPTGNTGNTMNTRRGTWLRESHGLWNFRGTWHPYSQVLRQPTERWRWCTAAAVRLTPHGSP